MKKASSNPLYDAGMIRGEMAKQQVTAVQIEQMSRKSGPVGVSVETVTKVRAGRNVKVSTLKAVCEALGLELRIIEKDAA